MSENSTAATDLTSQYSAQVANDLERNVKEQERVTADIAALQEQLTVLQHDHTILVNMQQALGLAAAPAGPPAVTGVPDAAGKEAPGGATVPAPRGTSGTRPGDRKPRRAKKEAGRTASAEPARKPAPAEADRSGAPAGSSRPAKAKTAGAKRAAAKGTEAKRAGGPSAKAKEGRADGPKLVELVRAHLEGQSEPRSAAEVAGALGEAHPGRAFRTTVVRNTLEGLVARNRAQRTKQGTSVFYTAPDAPEQAGQADAARS
ncbi:hypothetical protein GCM10010261_23910 [Streptomyces pilosus]|uniref:hypothetical protein n=1 Tax=Streptomyces pilosus TaxID=28893 RepID=UPI0016768A81|nr:hypothetical protein [Streptomyces pilosus]GGV47686.1 hypothetical protein GCM10010261_23910 [Streptomyces pilosus]